MKIINHNACSGSAMRRIKMAGIAPIMAPAIRITLVTAKAVKKILAF